MNMYEYRFNTTSQRRAFTMNKKIWAGVFAASMLFSMSGYAMAGETEA